MKILIDNGHGQSTPGKRSPDGRFLEFQFNRTIAKQIVDDLRDRGYDAELLVPEDDDIPLKDRCKRVNDIVAREGKQNVILISIHANAFGNGKEWTSPSGWSVYTSKGQTKADLLADDLAMAAIKYFGKQAIRGDFADGGLKPCCSGRKHQNACCKHPRDLPPAAACLAATHKMKLRKKSTRDGTAIMLNP